MNLNNYILHIDGAYFFTQEQLIPQILLALPFVLTLVMYILAVIVSNRRHKRWPLYRTVCWIFGVLFAIISVAGPLANRALVDFTAHMFGHLFLGMLAPIADGACCTDDTYAKNTHGSHSKKTFQNAKE